MCYCHKCNGDSNEEKQNEILQPDFPSNPRSAMGKSPTPTIVNLYVAIYKATYILPLLNSFLFYLKRFINGGLGIWLHDPDPDVDVANWILFKTLINAMGLRWTSTKLSKKATTSTI